MWTVSDESISVGEFGREEGVQVLESETCPCVTFVWGSEE